MKVRTWLLGASTIGALLLTTTLTGCTATGTEPEAESDATAVRLIVFDGALRPIGADCAGAIPYNQAHAGAEVVLIDESGDEALTVKLEPGEAIPADDLDYGNAARQPSLCLFTFDGGSGLNPGESYTVLIGDKEVSSLSYPASIDPENPPTIAVPPRGVAPTKNEN